MTRPRLPLPPGRGAPRRLDPPARCWLCGSTDAVPYLTAGGGWNYVRCQECSLVYLFPRPTPSELAGLYEQGYLDEFKGDGRVDLARLANARVAANGERVAFVNGLRKPGRLLEVGCAAGYFLEAARRQGWDGSGIETSPAAARFARETYGLAVTEEPIEEAGLREESFDVVALLHSLEHLPDPARTLREVGRVLRPGGLVYIEAPNLATPDAALRRASRDRVLLAPFHLFAFTPLTLTRFLTQAGFAGVLALPYVSGGISRSVGRGASLGKKLARHLVPSFVRPPEPASKSRRKKSDTAVARMKRVVQRLLPGDAMYATATKPVP
ncbi:MAG: class I SAM-dependent methyltransferase [Planctomycetes bacterium]|nr:class I SAM-dependent methyltransferase [Planctomycetota bacterium]